MKEWLGGSYLVMNGNPRVPGDIPLVSIRYKYNSRKTLVFMLLRYMEVLNQLLSIYLATLKIFPNISVRPVFRRCLIVNIQSQYDTSV